MAKPKQKQQERSAVELTCLARVFAKKLFPEHATDKEQMNVVEDFLYDLLYDNPDKSEEEIIGDVEEQIIAAKEAYQEDFSPERAVVLFERTYPVE